MSDRSFIQGRDAVAILQAAAALGENITVRDFSKDVFLDVDAALRLAETKPGSIEVSVYPANALRMLAALWRLRR